VESGKWNWTVEGDVKVGSESGEMKVVIGYVK
jgi:hypothetical protein